MSKAYEKYEKEKSQSGTVVKNTVETKIFSRVDQLISEFEKALAEVIKLNVKTKEVLSQFKKVKAEYDRAKSTNSTEVDRLFTQYDKSRINIIQYIIRIVPEIIKYSSKYISLYEKALISEIKALKAIYPEFKRAYIEAENKADKIYDRWKKDKNRIEQKSITPQSFTP